MNTAVAPAARFADNTSTNPLDRTRVYGFAPGLKYMTARGLVSGRGDIGQGMLVLFKPRVEGYLDGEFISRSQEFSARHQAREVQRKYGSGSVSGDTGFRVLDMLTPLGYDKDTGEDDAERYFAVIHPNQIGICEMGLETNVGADWELSGGQFSTAVPGPLSRRDPNKPSDPCATCRLKWLQSPECDIAISTSGLDANVLRELRNALIDSYTTLLGFARTRVNESKGEIAARAAGDNGKPRLDDGDFHYMALLHEKAPHIQQAELVSGQAQAQGEALAKAIADAMRGQPPAATPTVTVAGDSGEVAGLKAELAELKAMIVAQSRPNGTMDTFRQSIADAVGAVNASSTDVSVSDTDDLISLIADPTPKRRRRN